ncbi:unnamed protein product [Boreogadus saida]
MGSDEAQEAHKTTWENKGPEVYQPSRPLLTPEAHVCLCTLLILGVNFVPLTGKDKHGTPSGIWSPREGQSWWDRGTAGQRGGSEAAVTTRWARGGRNQGLSSPGATGSKQEDSGDTPRMQPSALQAW